MGAGPGFTPAGVQELDPSASPTRPKTGPEFSIVRRQGAWKEALRRRMLAGGDALAVLAAAGVIYALEGATAAVVTACLLPVWGLLAKLHGLYDRDHAKLRHLTLDEVSSLFYWVTLSVALSCLVLSLLPESRIDGLTAVGMWSAAFLTAFVLRAGARQLWRRVVPPDRTLVLGEGPLADAVRRKLALERGHHVELVAGPDRERLASLADAIEDLDVSRVVLARADLDESDLANVVATCKASEVRLSVAPPLQGMLGTAVNLNHLADMPLVEFRTWSPSRSTMFVKRAMDVAGAATLLVLAAPAMLLIAAWVRIDSPGPAIFSQLRSGKDGRPFRMLKFRTMVAGAEERLDEVIELEQIQEPVFKLRSDPRVTRVGRSLRRWSLDELPQLWNVLRGDMSLVGPRPEEVWLVARYTDAQRVRLSVRPGITGPMQTHGRAELTFAERLAVEREYIENYSFRKDLRILLETVAAVFRRQGAF